MKKRRLGRGLEALLSASGPEKSSAPERPVGSLADMMQGSSLPATAEKQNPVATGAVPPGPASPSPVSANPISNSHITEAETLPLPSVQSELGRRESAMPKASSEVLSIPPSESRSGTATALVTHGKATAAASQNDTSTGSAGGNASTSHEAEGHEGQLVNLPVLDIQENPFQPRRVFSEAEIASLSESLKEHDMLQPVLVRVVDGQYQLISGERRLRAAIQAGWRTIPARVRQADDRLVAELAIVENLQRKDLNAIEKALSFRRYLTEHQSTQEELALRLKIDRTTIANMMRLLELPPAIQDHVSHNRMTAGHARAILPLGEEREQMDFCRRILAEGWSVRETERRVAEYINGQDGPDQRPKRKVGNPQIEMLETQAKRSLGTAVQIKSNARGAGRMIIHFKNEAEFQRIFEMVCQERGVLAKVA